jgi:hypothetical protein
LETRFDADTLIKKHAKPRGDGDGWRRGLNSRELTRDRRKALAVVKVASLILAMASALRAQEDRPLDSFQRKALPVIDRYCIDCHMEGEAKGDLTLDRFLDQAEAMKDGRTWLRVLDAVESGVMPPPNKPRPTIA